MNQHATALRILDNGILIRGASGSGKTSLALALLARARAEQLDAQLIGDDQILLSSEDGTLRAAVPETLAGLIEIYPLGPRAMEFQPEGRIDLVIDLVAEDTVLRMEPDHTAEILGLNLPLLRLPFRSAHFTTPAVWSYLALQF